MTSDLSKGIQANGIVYNHLNLPVTITMSGITPGTISYIYTAAGTKVQKKVTNNSTNPATITTTDYISGFQYTNSVLDFFPTSEGYVKNTVVNSINTYNYVYQYKDHLSNVRVSYTLDAGEVKIMDENHYYPFGMEHEGYRPTQNILGLEPGYIVRLTPVINPGDATYKYKYNGKELQDELGLNMYDYGARNYDPALGRWMNIDPLAETSRRWSPYNYGFDNPMRFIDPDGMGVLDWVNKKGQVIYNADASKGKVGYTEHASKSDIRIGDNLQKTEAGKVQFDKLVNSSIPTTITVSNSKGPSAGTELYQTGNTELTRDDSGKVIKSDITIYKGRIDDEMKTVDSYYNAGQESKLPEEMQLYHTNTNSMDERVNANIGHEIEHAVSEENQATPCPACEVKPDEIEKQILEQTPSGRN